MDIQKVLCDRLIISSDPDIISGTPVFVGTRVPLQTFFDYLVQVLEVIAKAMLNQEQITYAHSA